ncbi:MAG TPA: type II secretion system F family protein [Tepidisphaeraceae bacterium]|nr:type II secretion system F family protein [Tepidisphaeraceae bacterium]
MDVILLPALAAAAVGLLVWWAVVLLSALTSGKRKLVQRLNNESGSQASKTNQLSAILPEDATAVPEFLARKPFIQTLRRKLSHAYPNTTLQKFLIISAVCALGPGVMGELLSANTLVALAAFAIGGYSPLLVLNLRCGRRVRTINLQLPEALDFLSRIMRAGHSLSTGLQMMSEELPAPISTEFRRAYDQHSLGQPLEDALREMAGRIESTDFAFFVTAVLIQRQTGGDLSGVLASISGMVRQRMRLGQQVRAKTAEGRFTGYIMVAFPSVMFGLCYFFNPVLYGGFMHESTGMMLLGTAAGLELMGLFMIKKITTVRV